MNRTVILAGLGVTTVATIGALMLIKGKPEEVYLYLFYDDTLGEVYINDVYHSPDNYKPIRGTTLTLKAVPKQGMYFNGWLVDGASKGADLAISLTMLESHTVSASFMSTEPAPPNGYIPATIYPITSPITVRQRVAAGFHQEAVGGGYARVLHCREDWLIMGLTPELVSFKVEDSAGHPVPNVPVELFTNPMPDGNDVGFRLELSEYLVQTMADGVATVTASYVVPDLKVFSLKHYHFCIATVIPVPICYCVYDGWSYGPGQYAWSRSIKTSCPEGIDVTTLDLPIVNTINAKIKDTVLQTMASVNCRMLMQLV